MQPENSNPEMCCYCKDVWTPLMGKEKQIRNRERKEEA